MNDTALVAGVSNAVSRGTVENFVAAGWNVVIAVVPGDSSPFEWTPSDSDQVLVAPVNLAEAESIDMVLAAGVETFGAIDVAINSAYLTPEDWPTTDRERIVRRFDADAPRLSALVRGLLPVMAKQDAGVLVHVSSVRSPLPENLLGTDPFQERFPDGADTVVSNLYRMARAELEAADLAMKLVEVMPVDTTTRTADTEAAAEGTQDLAEAFARVAEVVFEAATTKSDQFQYQVAVSDPAP